MGMHLSNPEQHCRIYSSPIHTGLRAPIDQDTARLSNARWGEV